MFGKMACIAAFSMLLTLSAGALMLYKTGKPQEKLLNLPPRKQWENGHGYCGETSVQTGALRYGTYVSQSLARRYAGGEMLVGENDQKLLRALRLTYDEWDENKPAPQYRGFLVWVKQRLRRGEPVIFTVYLKGYKDPDYDHIIPAVGFRAADADTYHGTDELIFYDNFCKTTNTRRFASLWSTRKIAKDAPYDYYIPKNVDYGVALKGIEDRKGETFPVSLSVDCFGEPNVTQGDTPRRITAKITVNSLQPGTKYLLLQYTHAKSIPVSGFSKKLSRAAKTVSFVAKNSRMTFSDSFYSDTLAAYRCVKA